MQETMCVYSRVSFSISRCSFLYVYVYSVQFLLLSLSPNVCPNFFLRTILSLRPCVFLYVVLSFSLLSVVH